MVVTRKIIFVAICIFGICLGLINSLISNVLDKIVSLISSSGVLNSSLSFSVDGNEQFINHIGQLVSNDGWLVRVMIDTSISFFLFGCLFIGGLIFFSSVVSVGLVLLLFVFFFFFFEVIAVGLEGLLNLLFKNFVLLLLFNSFFLDVFLLKVYFL